MTAVVNNTDNQVPVVKSGTAPAPSSPEASAALALSGLVELTDQLENLGVNQEETDPTGDVPPPPPPPPEPTPPPPNYVDWITMVAEMTARIQAKIAQSSASKLQSDQLITVAQQENLKVKLKDLIDNIDKIAYQKTHQPWWKKLITALVWIGAILGSIARPELAPVLITLAIMQTSGAMDDITKALAEQVIMPALIKDGMSEEDARAVANVIASVVVCVATIAATFGTGAIASSIGNAANAAKAGAVAAEAGIEMVQVGQGAAAAEVVGQQAAENVARVKGLFEKFIDIFKGLSTNTKITIMVGSQVVASQDPLGKAIAAMPDSMFHSKEEKQWLQMIASLLETLMAAILSMGAGAAMQGGALSESLKGLKILPQMTTMLKIDLMMQLLNAIPQGLMADSLIRQGVATKAVAIDNRDISLLRSIMEMLSNDQKTEQKDVQSVMKNNGQVNAVFGTMFSTEKMVADILAGKAV